MRILVLTTVLPEAARGGGEIAVRSIVDALERNADDIRVIGYRRTRDPSSDDARWIAAEERAIETAASGWRRLAWGANALTRGVPYSQAKFESSAFRATVSTVAADAPFDLAIINFAQLAWMLPHVRRYSRRVVACLHNVDHALYADHRDHAQNPLARWVYGREGRLVRRAEQRLVAGADEIWALTRDDAEVFAAYTPEAAVHVLTVPSPFEPPSDPPDKAFDVGLIGSWTWRANEDGLRWFFTEIYPRLPDTYEIRVAGIGGEWLAGRYPNVRYLGLIDDARRFMEQARVLAIPVRIGGGIQIKTLDAIASGSAVVAAPLALRGIDDAPSSVATAASVPEFAEKIAAALAAGERPDARKEAVRWSAGRRAAFDAEISAAVARAGTETDRIRRPATCPR